jgi:hypothetical protein
MAVHYFIERNAGNNNVTQTNSQKYGPVAGFENEEY